MSKPAPARAREPQRIPAAEFKARCLQLMDEVKRTRRPIVVTKQGRPVVRLLPWEEITPPLYGALRGWARAKGDIVGRLEVDWGALHAGTGGLKPPRRRKLSRPG